MRFTIFSHVYHQEKEKSHYAYAPYVREMNLWLQHVEEVEIVAPRNCKRQNSNAEAYQHDQVKFSAVPAFDLLNLKNSFRAIFLFPLICTRILAAMHRADHLHLRCPGNIGLLACVCQIFFPQKPKSAKYAGNWDPAARQPWTYRLQKWILSNTFLTRNMQVLVYGEWGSQKKNVVPFFTASFSEKDISSIEEKDFSNPLTFLFVGNLVEGKRPMDVIKLVEWINRSEINVLDQDNSAKLNGISVKLEIYGDGPEREKIHRYCQKHGLERQVHFYGSRPLEDLKVAYQKAHFVVLPSQSEGWPKALAEGMFYGCIPIATPVSCVPWMLDNGSRGVLLECLSQNRPPKGGKQIRTGQGEEDRDYKIELNIKNKVMSKTDTENLFALIKEPEEMRRMSEEAKEWSHQYTVEKFDAAIKEVLNKTS